MSIEVNAAPLIPGRYKARSTDTRTAILVAAERWFRQVGYRRTAVADVARDLGMSPANVFRFFSSKAALGEAVTERVLGEIATELIRIASREDVAPPERLRALLFVWAKMTAVVIGNDDHMKEMIQTAFTESWAACMVHDRQIDVLISRILDSGRVTGAFTAHDFEGSVRCIRSAMLCFTHPGLLGRTATSPTPHQITAFVLHALSTTPRSPRSAMAEAAEAPGSSPVGGERS